jgi:unsaturated chondroitin disaccharide hydrolase
MKIEDNLTPTDLLPALERFWALSGEKIRLVEEQYDLSQGSPVFTCDGRYTTRGWTEWTEGFVYGSAILQFDATGDCEALELGRKHTVQRMAAHVSHVGVHDHGFNNLSTYGNLLRLMIEGKIPSNQFEKEFYSLALKVSGAVQANRWTSLPDGGFIHSFNGPHSLFIDTVRSCRILVVAHLLGHVLMGEQDARISLLGRALTHIRTFARYNVYYGEGRDSYDEWGRTAHEAVFNTVSGAFRCPNAQQGFSGFTTWTRGLSWAMCGFAEELEALALFEEADIAPFGDLEDFRQTMLKAARATCDWFIANTALDGITYWDGGAPNLHRLGDWRERPAEPDNDWEPVDSTAAAIGAQGLLRLGSFLGRDTEEGKRYWQAGLTSARTLFSDAYLSLQKDHQGLLLHSIYHEPNGWDRVPEGHKVAQGESSMWGDYHIRELALQIQRIARNEPELTFFRCAQKENGGQA